jgi:cyclic dehypoxanthinyl futalosine synthase
MNTTMLDDRVVEKVLDGERITADDAMELHRLPLNELGQLADRRREAQDQTGGFMAFICWTFQPENVVLKATPVGSAEYLRIQAISRIYLDNIENIQSSWVTQGPKIGQIALRYGANDFGSVMMEENVVSQAGTSFQITRDE